MHDDRMVVSLKKESRPQPPAQEAPPPRLRKRRIMPLLLLVLFFIAASGGGYYGYKKFFAESEKIVEVAESAPVSVQEDSSAVATDVEDIVEAVGKLIVLPQGEEPTVATVTDPEKLKEQAFFANAKTGDKVLIYTKAKKAYLYDPTLRKLIEVAPITTEAQ